MTNGTGAGEAPPRPTMTMRVYTVDRYGTITSDRGTVSVLPVAVLPASFGFPPCACPRCPGRGGEPVNATIDQDNATAPADLTTMRETIDVLLDAKGAPAGPAPSADELETLTATLRGHLEVLMPEVERLMVPLSKTSILRYCVLVCLGEARERLRAEPTPRYGGRLGYTRRLARVLNALCDHHEELATGALHEEPGDGR
ncbi:DUF6415 family natural product biosynthesis protein [Streptomyces griseosporeus]|uniref:DUF6415 family natural product biosynthesis protein n=1 Tax=Streptomyces griseosporeus TaxID=1910 RepID=UPI003675C163